jgi:hypothetical protein
MIYHKLLITLSYAAMFSSALGPLYQLFNADRLGYLQHVVAWSNRLLVFLFSIVGISLPNAVASLIFTMGFMLLSINIASLTYTGRLFPIVLLSDPLWVELKKVVFAPICKFYNDMPSQVKDVFRSFTIATTGLGLSYLVPVIRQWRDGIWFKQEWYLKVLSSMLMVICMAILLALGYLVFTLWVTASAVIVAIFALVLIPIVTIIYLVAGAIVYMYVPFFLIIAFLALLNLISNPYGERFLENAGSH